MATTSGGIVHKLPPSSHGTVLPFSLVVKCLQTLVYAHPERNSRVRLAAMRAVCLCSKAWNTLGRSFLHGYLTLTPRRVDRSSGTRTVAETRTITRSARLLATLLANRQLARWIVSLELDVASAPAVDLFAATSLFGDCKRLLYLHLLFKPREAQHLASKIPLLQTANTLVLEEQVTPGLANVAGQLTRVRQLEIRGSLPDADFAPPAFWLSHLALEGETSRVAFDVPARSVALRTSRCLVLLQPSRTTKNGSDGRHLDASKVATFVTDVLASARQLPFLVHIALRNVRELGNARWPDMRRSSPLLFGRLPANLEYLPLTVAAASLDLRNLDDILCDKAMRMPALQLVTMDKIAKSLVPRPGDEYERAAAAKGVQIFWTACAVHSASCPGPPKCLTIDA
ncbi:hypothetical protein JCM10908_006428 [Rhodotorula pacifica]|uniref:uncharacterized protein n=1 Tax=Rhodotorula pacifica TaxID=1495444 RepID=UPI00317735B4